MAIKTSTEIKQELDDLLSEDTVDAAPWTESVKQRAINRAIRDAWPYFKVEKKDESIELAATTFIYSLAAIADIEDRGINRIYIEPEDASVDWYPTRRIQQMRVDQTWFLYVPEDLASGYAGHALRLHYYTRPAELSFNGEPTDVLDARFADYVVYRALCDLFQIAMLGGSDFNVDVYAAQIPIYEKRAMLALKENTVLEMPALVGMRSESTF